jgi:uncharacterized protein YecE (DUF72 family)
MNYLPEYIRIGTCSWKYDSWKGLIYSENVGKAYLTEYARHYNIVEVDQWFWSLFGEKVVMPKPVVVNEYVGSVPKEFRFSVKIPNAITLTHQYSKGRKGPLEVNPYFLSNDLFEKFLKILEPMESQIDSLIFQFEYLNKQKMPDQNSFQDKLQKFFERTPPVGRYCIEIRNQNYLNKTYFDFLKARNLAHVFLHGYWMPSIFSLYEKHKNDIEKFTVIRLHGPDRTDIEKKANNNWNRVLEPRDNELDLLKTMINDLIERKIQVTISVNNHYEGSAPLTIDRLLQLF